MAQWAKERTTSPLYGTYIFSVILWNWKFFYTLFFQDQTVLGMPKIEYVENKFLGDGIVEHLLFFVVWPLVTTCFIIWIMPFFSSLAHKAHLRFYFDRKNMYDAAALEYENKKSRNLQQLVRIKKEQMTNEKEIEKNLTEADLWAAEFNEFARSSIFNKFRQVIRAIYEDNGYINRQFSIDTSILAVADSRGLIKFITGPRSQIEFTEKGKLFVKKYLEINPF